MSSYRLLKHKNYDRSAENLPETIQRKALWAQLLLGMRGRTPSVKGTTGLNVRWRRTPVQGNHYYMWWIPRSESSVPVTPQEDDPTNRANNTILIHSIRHHDETNDPIELGSLDDYEEVAVDALDPRYAEQQSVSAKVNSEYVALATIKGLPGSGKTVSLLYLVKDLAQRADMREILYVTYTNRLKRAAVEFLEAQGPHIKRIVKVCTLNEIEHEITSLPTFGEPFTDLRDFTTFLELQNAATLGPWKKYPQTLYTELRAHLLGRTFPPGYSLPAGKLNQLLFRPDGISAMTYAAQRELALPDAELAWRLAERLRDGRFFQDQKAAYLAVERLRKGKSPSWLAQLDAVIIDEVQDLTLLQIGLLGELVRERIRRRQDAPFVFVVAGDESQIVQPSGFDWGVSKDLLGEQLGLWPDEFQFQHQRRSPRNLAQLIDNTWALYGHLPKAQRPSASRQLFVYEDEQALRARTVNQSAGNRNTDSGEENGQIFICTLPRTLIGSEKSPGPAWLALLQELADKPGRVLIDLTDTLRATLIEQPVADADEVIFLAREIKGLERATVVVYGLNTVYLRAMRLCEEQDGGNIPKFEARRIFDEIRVALSRSTDKLILLEPADAPVLAELAVTEVPGALVISWQDLIETLQLDDMSAIEMIEGYLDEVDDLFERNAWEQGYRRNRRAYDLATQLGDSALQREAQEQYIGGYLQEATDWLQRNVWQEAHTRNRQAQTLATQFGDPLLEEQVEDQFADICTVIAQQARQQISQAQTQLEQKQFKIAYQTIQAAATMTNLIQTTANPSSAIAAEQATLTASVDEVSVAVTWQWAGQLVGGAYAEDEARHAAQLLSEAAAVMERQADKVGAQALHVLSERYRTLPQHANLAAGQIETLLNLARRYLEIVEPLDMAQTAYVYLHHWLEEAFASLHQQTALYYRWALIAQAFAALATYSEMDEHLWDLENRMNLLLEHGKRKMDDANLAKFRALLLAYNDDAQGASLAWEQLGEMTMAADYAREAGEMERAYHLLRQTKAPIPEELAIAVKTMRLLQQLEQKYQGLHSEERRVLLEQLAALHTTLTTMDSAERTAGEAE
ncbi:MAG: AAA family ATPase [Chloroflexi bacterium]|nr:AAA family ATPase [Chloroflexota bacterium]